VSASKGTPGPLEARFCSSEEPPVWVIDLGNAELEVTSGDCDPLSEEDAHRIALVPELEAVAEAARELVYQAHRRFGNCEHKRGRDGVHSGRYSCFLCDELALFQKALAALDARKEGK
jgi:hypothetical protein